MYFEFDTADQDLKSIFECWVSGVRSYCVCQLSGGGGAGRGNKDYLKAQQCLLERLAAAGMKIVKVSLVSGRNQAPPYDDSRELDLKDLPNQDDVRAFRIAVNRLAKNVGRDASKPGGSRTKKLLYEVSWPGDGKLLERDVLKALDFVATGQDQDDLKYKPLGDYLEAQDDEVVVLPIDKIAELVGGLPKSSRSAQFWANAQNYHWSRRKQWLLRGFEAYWEPKGSQVRFIRGERPTDDPTLLSARIEHQRERIRKKTGSSTTPSGSQSPRKVRSFVYRYERSASIVAWVLEQARGSCEGCRNVGPFVDDKREHYLEVHHIRPLAEGGPDTVDNAAALCPACHRELHYGFKRDAQRTRLLNEIERLVDHPRRTRE